MVFRRREKRSWLRIAAELLWPRGGWGRAAQYVQHRLRRLPDKPDRIARGIFAGVFVSFTPLYGLHFVAAAVVAKIMNGNILAALLATFFGNPLTFPLIAWASLSLGTWILGIERRVDEADTLARKFSAAAGDLWHNLGAVFTDAEAHWDGLNRFFFEVFFPYFVGGILPGIVAATISYYLARPLITAYQNRRKIKLQRKLDASKVAAKKPVGTIPSG